MRTYEHHMLVADTRKSAWMERLDERLQEMGSQGWEMVAVMHSMEKAIVFLKREPFGK